MSDLPAHWLYPVNSTTDSWVDTLDGPELVSPDAIRRLDFDRQAFWDLSSGYRAMQRGDLLWVYFARPEQTVGALGRVLGVQENENDSGYEVVLSWDEAATTALRSGPIPLAMLGRAPRAVRRADARAADALRAWLNEQKVVEYPVPYDPQLLYCSRCDRAVLLPIAGDLPHNPWIYRGAGADDENTHGCRGCGWEGAPRVPTHESATA